MLKNASSQTNSVAIFIRNKTFIWKQFTSASKKYQTAALAYKTSYYKNFVCGSSSLKLTQKTSLLLLRRNVVNSTIIL